MAHPGMAPVVADLVERNDAYEATITLTMAGDWTFVAAGPLANGRQLVREFATVAR